MLKNFFSKTKLSINIKPLRRFRFFFITIFFVGVIIDIYLNINADMSLLLLCALWILVIKLFNYKSATTFKVTLVFLFGLFSLFVINPDQNPIERIATWIFIFLFLGIFQQYKEIVS